MYGVLAGLMVLVMIVVMMTMLVLIFIVNRISWQERSTSAWRDSTLISISSSPFACIIPVPSMLRGWWWWCIVPHQLGLQLILEVVQLGHVLA